mgnify:CR=1 FL=1
MNLYEYYTKDQIKDICLYYGQFYDNLTYNMRALLIEKYEYEMEVK